MSWTLVSGLFLLKIRFHLILILELSGGATMSGFTKFGLVTPPGKLVVNFLFFQGESWNLVFPLERKHMPFMPPAPHGVRQSGGHF